MSSSDQQETTLGGRHPVDAKDPKIQEVAAWAVAEYDKEHGTNLKYETTLKAEREGMIGSTTYFIDLEASEGCIINKYYAKVIEIICEFPTMKLEVFELQGNEPIPVGN